MYKHDRKRTIADKNIPKRKKMYENESKWTDSDEKRLHERKRTSFKLKDHLLK